MNDSSPPNHWNEATRALMSGRPSTLPSFRLKWSHGEQVFSRTPITVGSGPDNDVALKDSAVSRRHARIVRLGLHYLIRDCESTNGVYVDGVRIQEAVLHDNAVIRLGETSLTWSGESTTIASEPSPRSTFGKLVGDSEVMRRLFHLIEKVAATDATVLVQGETGTGKELTARAVHEYSIRHHQPFVVVDCSAIPANLIESELFGHEKGAFSGALTVRKGLFEVADKGTVFLDEVGELPQDLQPKLLRVLDTGTVRRVGSSNPISLDVRVVAATNRPLESMVQEGTFRSDLFYRLSVVPVVLPPLRDRPEDIPPLVKHILATASFNQTPQGQQRVLEVGPRAIGELVLHPFPGNVRELVNILERESALADGPAIHQMAVPLTMETPARVPPVPEKNESLPKFSRAKQQVINEFERHYLERLLIVAQGNLSRAARMAEVDRKHLRELLKRHGLYEQSGTGTR